MRLVTRGGHQRPIVQRAAVLPRPSGPPVPDSPRRSPSGSAARSRHGRRKTSTVQPALGLRPVRRGLERRRRHVLHAVARRPHRLDIRRLVHRQRHARRPAHGRARPQCDRGAGRPVPDHPRHRNGRRAASAAPAEQPEQWYWPSDATVEDDHLHVMALRMRATGTGPWDFEILGTDLVTYALPDLALRAIRPLRPPRASRGAPRSPRSIAASTSTASTRITTGPHTSTSHGPRRIWKADGVPQPLRLVTRRAGLNGPATGRLPSAERDASGCGVRPAHAGALAGPADPRPSRSLARRPLEPGKGRRSGVAAQRRNLHLQRGRAANTPPAADCSSPTTSTRPTGTS